MGGYGYVGEYNVERLWCGKPSDLLGTNTVDGSEIRDSPVEGKVVEIPLFKGFFDVFCIQTVVGNGISEPSTSYHPFKGDQKIHGTPGGRIIWSFPAG